MRNIKVLILITALHFASTVHAAVSPLAFGLFPPVYFPPSSFDVAGVRASAIFGHHRSMTGIDIGAIGNITDLNFAGIAVAGGFNETKGNTTIVGAQIAGIANINKQKTTVIGVQAAAYNENDAEAAVVGVSAGVVNITEHTNTYILQAGLYNKAYKVTGFQVGLINYAEEVMGFQIGLINFNHKGVFSVCPVINFGF